MRSIMFVGMCLLASMTAQATDVPMAKVEANAFEDQRAAIVAGFADGERYAEIDKTQREEVMGALDRMQELLGSSSSVNELSQEARVALYNDQEIVNNILTDAQAASREVCKRHRSVNSRISTNECHTVAEWERRRERARELARLNKRFENKQQGNPRDSGN